MSDKPLSETILEYYGGLGEVTLTQDDVDNLIKDIQKIEAERDQLKEQCNTCQMHNPTLQVRKQRLTIANLKDEVKTLTKKLWKSETLLASEIKLYHRERDRLAKAEATLEDFPIYDPKTDEAEAGFGDVRLSLPNGNFDKKIDDWRKELNKALGGESPKLPKKPDLESILKIEKNEALHPKVTER